MKPVELVFQGLNSYTEEARIDFEKLHKAGIFGIFGETGAGKTTILDAITIALYGRTDRLNSISEVTNPASKRVYVRFKFKMDGKLYEVYREYEDGSAKSQALYEYIGHSKKPIADKTREINGFIQDKIIGLNFEDFTKVVILPQGKFSRFLDATPAEKTRILSKIFSTDVFGNRLFNAVKLRRDLAKSRIVDLKNQLAELQEINENLVNSLIEEQVEIKRSIIELKEKKIKLEEQFRNLTKLQELLRENKELEEQKKELKQQEPEIQRLQEKLEIAEKLFPISILVQSIEKARVRRKELEKSVVLLESRIRELEPHYIRKKEEWENFIENEYPKEQRELHLAIKKADDALKKAIEIKKIEKKVKSLTLEFTEVREQLKDFQDLSEKLQILKSKLEEMTLTRKEEELLKSETKIISKITEINQLQNQLKSLEEKFSRDRERVETKILKLLKKIGVSVTQEDPISNLKESIEEIKLLKSEKEKLLKEKEELSIAIRLAHNLEEGKPCPVCGSIHHPSPPEQTIQIEEIEELKRKIKELEEREKILIGTLERVRELTDSLEVQKKRFDRDRSDLDSNLKRVRENLLRLARTFGCKDIDCLLEKLERTKKKKEAVDRLLRDERELSDKIRTLQEAKEKFRVMELELSQMKSRIEELNRDIKELIGEKLPEKVKETSLRKLEALEKRKKLLAEKFDTFKRNFEELQTKLKTNRQLLNDTLRDLDEYQTRLENEAKRLKMSVEELKRSILPEEEIKKLKSRIGEFEKKLDEINTRLRRVGEELEKLPFNKLPEGEPENTRKMLDSVTEKFDSMNVKLGEIGNAIEESKKKLNLKKRLQKELSEFMKMESHLSELYSLFHGKKFSKFVSRFYLTEIIHEANHFLLELTGGRLKIVGTKGDEIEFQVFDSFTGHARSTKSLSGGERFLVSFSLAISFSLYIQRRSTKSIDFFFIDEGFGTLDEDLQDAMGRVFEQIQRTGKLVGLITHVRKFREIVPAQILVTRDTTTKSSRIAIKV